MRVLGIDTILHDACAAVVEDGRFVLSNVGEHTVMESDKLYRLIDLHLNQIGPVVKNALQKAGCRPEDISLIAVNNFGSLFSNVLIGVVVAQALARIFNKPLITVHHQEAHLFSCWLERDPKDFRFPIVVFSSSGGHSAICLIKNNKLEFKTLLEIKGMEERKKGLPYFRGLGAVYGLVANALGLAGSISSAPLLSRAARTGDSSRFNLIFRRPAKNNILDFSFIEKEARLFLKEQKKGKGKLSRKFIADFAAGFENAVSEIVLNDLVKIAKKNKAKEIHLVGGISANRIFRRKLPVFASKIGAVGRFPVKPEYSTDNAAMIASLGYYKYKLLFSREEKQLLNRGVKIDSNLKLEEMAINQRKAKKDVQ